MEHNTARSEPKSLSTYAGQGKDNARVSASASGGATDAMERGKDAIGSAASDAMTSAGSDFQALRNDLNGLKDTVMKFVSQAGGEAAKSAREVTSNVAGQVSSAASGLADKGAEMAGAVSDQAKTFASEVESMARRNPLGALAGAVAVGFLIGTMGRRS
jgi:ElaB/YqjD/DUF883 family membrane-anchored ribosome-binding protein